MKNILNVCIFTVSLLVIFSSVLWSETNKPEADQSPKTINPLSVQSIRFEGLTGEDALLRSIVQTSIGKEIDPDQLSKDIKNVAKDTGLFSNISVDVEPYEEGGLEVIFRLVESPKIEGLKIVGNEKIRYSKIKEAINFKSGAQALGLCHRK